MNAYRYPILLLSILVLTACTILQDPPARVTFNPTATSTAAVITPAIVFTLLASSTFTPTATISPTTPPTSTPLPSPSPTETPTPIPTYQILRGTVNVEHAACRYGPGYPYLYKYGLLGGSNLEIIARRPDAQWIEIRAIGGNNPCWVKASLLDIHGDIWTVQPINPEDVHLPFSPYYKGPITGISAYRIAEKVYIFWDPFIISPGKDSEQYRYLIEAWLCHDGQIVFTPEGTYETAIILTDEPGCSEPSHARIYGVEKHGYTLWAAIPWPPAEPTRTP